MLEGVNQKLYLVYRIVGLTRHTMIIGRATLNTRGSAATHTDRLKVPKLSTTGDDLGYTFVMVGV